ncbi:Serine/threonine-protein kinase HT1 [Leucoagaricus sp. SymC.cos]|nr:Serine/threonine-protein kinase HT1 [Leucoagaricus sp. SymC.cos]
MATGSEASACVKVVRQAQDCTSVAYHKKLVKWAHLSHPNILPLYALSLESEDHPSFVSPSESAVKICNHAWSLTSDQRLPLILDVINGLCHLHQLNIVHGGLSPGTVLVSDEGRALITNLDIPTEEEDSNTPLTCYSAPELSLEDDSRPMRVTDVWAFGCLGHEVLSGKVLFCQISSDSKAISAIGRGDKPARPGQDGRGGSAINNAIWDLLMRCWEYEAADCPTSSNFQEMLLYMHTEDCHPEPKSIIEPKAIQSSITNLELAKAVLSQILGSHEPASLQVPKHLRDTLSQLVCNSEALDTTEVAAKKLNRDDTQTLVDLIELKGVAISDKGQALIVPPNMSHIFFQEKTFESWDIYTDRFYRYQSLYSFWTTTLLNEHQKVLSRKLPYYQVPNEQVGRKQVCYGGQPLIWPDRTDAEMDEIDDKAWELITKCCAREPKDQPNWSQIQEMLANMEIEEDRRPPAMPLPIPEVQALRSCPEVDLDHAEIALNQAEVLHGPLSELIQNHTKDVAMVVAEFKHDEIQAICLLSFMLPLKALKECLTIAEERNRVLAILSRITSSTLIFPQCYELRGIKYDPHKHLAEGRCGIAWVKEVILWAHSSHPNILPFLGVSLDGQSNPPPTCLVSLFMKHGNLRDYASRLPQKSRLPLILDVVNGLCYLHDLGVVHGDLKGENVLISNEGHGLITDFGTSHINTTTAATGSLSLTTLCFSASETVLGNRTLTKKFDIWSLDCLLYKEMPKCPGSINENDAEKDKYGWDDDIEEDYDAIDNQAWSLIVKCCVPEPETQPDIANV